MSIIHVNQIKTQVDKLFRPHIDMSDKSAHASAAFEDHLLSRGIAAFAVHVLSAAPVEEAAKAITDGGDDNGIDAIYFDSTAKRLYLVQSKWIKDGTGEPSNGDIKKFVGGVHDLFNLKLDRFNAKVQAMQSILTTALSDPNTRYEVVVAHTGASTLATPSERDLADLASELNDVSEVVYITVLNQAELHKTLSMGVAGDPIDLQLSLRAWGRKEESHEAFYGQVAAEQVVDWWQKYRHRLFARNLRGMLGDTEVNAEIRHTLEQTPELFWYYNNGITLLARTVSRAMAGGAGHDFGTFHCADVSVVNGAQTVSTIGRFGAATPGALEAVYVPIRIIARGGDEHFADEVTRTNNRQNRIEGRDFVTLDPEQSRIRTDLAIDGIDYQYMRADTVVRSDTAFDLVEATTALACASGTIKLPVQLKREIGKLWEDIDKAPYKELFNGGTAGIHVWRAVQVQRRIDKAIEGYARRTSDWSNLKLMVHGHRIVAALTFEGLPVARFKDPTFDPATAISDGEIIDLVDKRIGVLSGLLQQHYANAMIPTLFKNLKKCEHLAEEARKQL